jgi:hypothetical protein
MNIPRMSAGDIAGLLDSWCFLRPTPNGCAGQQYLTACLWRSHTAAALWIDREHDRYTGSNTFPHMHPPELLDHVRLRLAEALATITGRASDGGSGSGGGGNW